MRRAFKPPFTLRRTPWSLYGLILAIGLVCAIFASQAHMLSLDDLGARRKALKAFVSVHPVESLAVYMGVYLTAIVLFLPAMTVLLLAGGLLFGVALGSVVAIATALCGGALIFVVARSTLGKALRGWTSSSNMVEAMKAGVRRHAFSYLVTLRLVPIFPFSLVSAVAGMIGVSLRTFCLATVLGIAPAALIYTSVGVGLDAVFNRGGPVDLEMFATPAILGPLLALAALSLIPHLYCWWKAAAARRTRV